MGFFDLIHNWQELMGALIGAFVAIVGSFFLSIYLHHQRETSERKRQYSNLLLILQDIRRFISKCELYLESANKNMIPFDKIILNEKLNYMGPSQVFNLEPEFYTSIEQIYSIAGVISYNFKLSEVLEVHVKKKKGKEIHSQKNVISNKHWDTLNLLRYYLTDVYHKFNIIVRDVKKLQEKYKYLKFTKDITFYKKEYVVKKVKDFKLENHYP